MVLERTFPKLVCVNLGRDQNRRLYCEELFELNRLHVLRFAGIDAKTIKALPVYSTAKAYARCIGLCMIIRRAIQERVENLFIFEDDVQLASDWRERLDAIALPDNWQIFFLGCEHKLPPRIVGDGLVRVTNASHTYAFGLRAAFFREFMNLLQSYKTHVLSVESADWFEVSAEVCNKFACYAAFPNLAWQNLDLRNSSP